MFKAHFLHLLQSWVSWISVFQSGFSQAVFFLFSENFLVMICLCKMMSCLVKVSCKRLYKQRTELANACFYTKCSLLSPCCLSLYFEDCFYRRLLFSCISGLSQSVLDSLWVLWGTPAEVVGCCFFWKSDQVSETQRWLKTNLSVCNWLKTSRVTKCVSVCVFDIYRATITVDFLDFIWAHNFADALRKCI